MLATVLATACGPTGVPELASPGDQIAEVGSELRFQLDGGDRTGDRVRYAYASDLRDLAGRAQLIESPDGTAEFRWTPVAADVGSHPFDFTITDDDGGATAMVTIAIVVEPAIGAGAAPMFREPVGAGTALGSDASCVELAIAVTDEVAASVAIAQAPPVIDGAQLAQLDGLDASWQWCPTAAQRAAADRYTLALTANDGTSATAVKDYVIVLLGGDGSACPGVPPVIASAPADIASSQDVTIAATITDDVGVKGAPLAYYATDDPGDPPNLAAMTQVDAALASGDAQRGAWTARVPNPVASAAAGTTAELYYVFVATDGDDPRGACDHTVVSAVYREAITATAGAAAAACAPCSADAECGDGNECVAMDVTGASYCTTACSADGACGSGTTCSAAAIPSIDGASALQCVPVSGSCVAPDGPCEDDDWEVNDDRSDAAHNPVLAPGTYALVSCPSATGDGGNDDWFKLEVGTGDEADAWLDLQLVGDGATDLDLHLYHSDGTLVAASTSVTPDEEIAMCVPTATYYVKVDANGHARSEYILAYAVGAECAP